MQRVGGALGIVSMLFGFWGMQIDLRRAKEGRPASRIRRFANGQLHPTTTPIGPAILGPASDTAVLRSTLPPADGPTGDPLRTENN